MKFPTALAIAAIMAMPTKGLNATEEGLTILGTKQSTSDPTKFEKTSRTGKVKTMDFTKLARTPKGENGYMRKNTRRCKPEGVQVEEEEPLLVRVKDQLNTKSRYPISHYNTENTDSSKFNGPDAILSDVQKLEDKALTVDLLTDYDFFEKMNFVDIAATEVDKTKTFTNHQEWLETSGFNKMEHDLVKYDGLMAPITLTYTSDNNYVWGSSFTHIMKLKREGGRLQKVATIDRPHWQEELLVQKDLFHGAYAVINDRDHYFSPGRTAIYEYVSECATNHDSGIIMKNYHDLNLAEDDSVRGLSFSDKEGKLVFITKQGSVGSIDTQTKEQILVKPDLPRECEGGEVSNNFAIYHDERTDKESMLVVTDKCVLSFDTEDFQLNWVNKYNTEGERRLTESIDKAEVGGRLGAGSGTTPSLVEGCGGDKYLVIADGEQVMSYLMFDIHTGDLMAKDIVDFGDKDTKFSTTEQSILTYFNKFTLTNNAYKTYEDCADLKFGETLCPIFYGDDPKGLHTFEVTCDVDGNFDAVVEKWVNSEVSIPNGITTSSLKDGTIYGVGKREFLYDELSNLRLKTKVNLENFFVEQIVDPKTLSRVGKFAAYSKLADSEEAEVAGIRDDKMNDFLIINDLVNEGINRELRKDTGKSKFTPITAENREKYNSEDIIKLWTIEAVDSETGEPKWFKTLGAGLKYNSAYAATELGPENEILWGTALGVARMGFENKRDAGPHGDFPRFVYEDGKWTLAAENQ